MKSSQLLQAQITAQSESLFTWIWFATLSVILFGLVSRYGSEIPYGDDWNEVPVLIKGIPRDLNWYFQSVNSHRFPLVKLNMATTWAISKGALVGIYLHTFLYLLITAATIYVILKGSSKAYFSDVLLPACMLSIGHLYNLLWWIQGFFLLFGALFTFIAISFIHSNHYEKRRFVCLIGICLICLSWQGAMGAVATPFLAVCYFLVVRKNRPSKRATIFAAAVVVMSCVNSLMVIGDLLTKAPDSKQISFQEILFNSIEFFANGFGLLPRLYYPLMVGTTIIATALIGITMCNDRAAKIYGSISLAAIGIMAFSIAMSRSSAVATRYQVLAMPAIIIIYCLYRKSFHRGFGRFVCYGLCSVATATLAYDASAAVQWFKLREQNQQHITNAINEGVPLQVIAGMYSNLQANSSDQLERGLESLRRSDLRPYAAIKDIPKQAETISPTIIKNANKEQIVFSLETSTHANIIAVRVDYEVLESSTQPSLKLNWIRLNHIDKWKPIAESIVTIKGHDHEPRERRAYIQVSDAATELKLTCVNCRIKVLSMEVITMPDLPPKVGPRL